MCTEKQQKCIYAVSKELDIEYDREEVENMSVTDASSHIDQLKVQLMQQGNKTVQPEFNEWRFGMCVKQVLDHMNLRYAIANSEEFVLFVGKTYQLVSDTEKKLKEGTKLERVIAPVITQD